AAGEEVHVVARGRHLEAIVKDGLSVRSELGDVTVRPAGATDDPAAIGPCDVAIIAVKLYDIEDAARAAAPLVGPETMVVSLQNGVTAGDVLAGVHGAERVIGGSSSIAARIEAPGVIEHLGTMADVSVGEWDGAKSPRATALSKAFEKAGVDVTLADDITAVIWSKFVFLASFSGITCALRLPIGPIREDAETRALLRRAFDEVFAVARARDVALPDDLVDQRMDFADGLPAPMYASMYHDLAAGRGLELPWLSGTVVSMGRELGVPTPAHESFWLALKLYADGAPAAPGSKED
ncbi:MAG: ketopantoate reductase family protein, partial [Rhodospirillales bacterium]